MIDNNFFIFLKGCNLVHRTQFSIKVLQSYNILELLTNEDSKAFIISNLDSDISMMSLKFKGKTSFNLTECLQLLKIYQKAKYKLPQFISYLPALTDRSYQQSTSEKVANFKSTLLSGGTLVDLSAGLGIDDIAFSKSFKNVISVDSDKDLNELVRYNLRLMGIENITRLTARAEEISIETADWIYLDPDRRQDNNKYHGIEQLQPNVLSLIAHWPPNINIAIKLSPMFEVKELFNKFRNIYAVYSISESNEVKEILVLIKGECNDNKLVAVDLGNNGYLYESTINAWQLASTQEFNEDISYLYLFKSSISKLHLDGLLAWQLNLTKMAGFDIYTAQNEIIDSRFRTFRIEIVLSASLKVLKKWLKQNGLERINIIVKGSKEQSSSITKKLGVKDGSDQYLILVYGKINKAFIGKFL